MITREALVRAPFHDAHESAADGGRTPCAGTSERRTQVDMRFAKIVRFGRSRADIGVDLTNLFNTNYATGYNETYVFNTDNTPRPAGWATPSTIYTPRFVRLNFTVNF
jgi:hypothetical protein